MIKRKLLKSFRNRRKKYVQIKVKENNIQLEELEIYKYLKSGKFSGDYKI